MFEQKELVGLAVRWLVLFVCNGFGIMVFKSPLCLSVATLVLFFSRLIFAYFEARSREKWNATKHSIYEHNNYDDFCLWSYCFRMSLIAIFFHVLCWMGWIRPIWDSLATTLFAWAFGLYMSIFYYIARHALHEEREEKR